MSPSRAIIDHPKPYPSNTNYGEIIMMMIIMMIMMMMMAVPS